MDSNDGLILKLTVGDRGKWTAASWRALPGCPIFSRALVDGRLLVSTYGGAAVISPDGEMKMFMRQDAGLPPRLEQ